MIRQTASGLWIIESDSHISKWVEEKGQLQHDFQTLPLILPLIKEGDVVVDAGANIGDTAIPFAERVGPAGTIYAFEPLLEAFECLRLNAQKYPQVIVDNVGLGDVHAGLTMKVTGNVGASFIEYGGIENMKSVFIPLDSLELPVCDFLKIDVEGYETHVLTGAENTIERCRPIMLIEVNEGALRRQNANPLDVFCWLYNHKYRWWPVVGADLNQGSPQYDILARPI